MQRLLILLLVLVLSGLSYATSAKSNTYGLLSLGYADADLGQVSQEGMGYSLALGYELNKQWFVELGFQQLLDQQGRQPSDAAAPLGEDDRFKADALYVAMLGKASSARGTLFYRVGLMTAKVEAITYVAANDNCERGKAQSLAVQADANAFFSCTVDNTHLAAVVGLGFDWRLAQSLHLRTEIQHVRGESDWQTSTLQLGLRYDF